MLFMAASAVRWSARDSCCAAAEASDKEIRATIGIKRGNITCSGLENCARRGAYPEGMDVSIAGKSSNHRGHRGHREKRKKGLRVRLDGACGADGGHFLADLMDECLVGKIFQIDFNIGERAFNRSVSECKRDR